MIEAVDFVSLETFVGIEPTTDMAVVSVGDPDEAPPAHLPRFAAWLRLAFLDCEGADVARHGVPVEVLCSHRQMQEFIRFVAVLHADLRSIRLVIHCRMGSSRSAALALVAHKLTACAFPRHDDAHFANLHVIGLGERALAAAIPVPSKDADGPHSYLPLALQI